MEENGEPRQKRARFGWMDRWMDRWSDRRINERMNGQVDKWIDGWMDGWMIVKNTKNYNCGRS